jgi:hypothetical protein
MNIDRRDIFSLVLGVPILLLLTVLTLTGQDSGEALRAIGVLGGCFLLRFGVVPLWDLFANRREERRQRKEKKALAKKAREAAEVLSPLSLPLLNEAQTANAVLSAHHALAIQQEKELERIERELASFPIEMNLEQHRAWFKLIVAKANITHLLPRGYWEWLAAKQDKDAARYRGLSTRIILSSILPSRPAAGSANKGNNE